MNRLPVLLDSHGIIVTNKQPGVSSDEHDNDNVPSMETRMKLAYPQHKLLHRIDKWTSGLLLFGDPSVYWWVRNNWHKAVTKQYLAIMETPMWDTNFCDIPLIKEEKGEPQVCKTTFTVIDANAEGLALVRADMEWGRKHQIRKHASLLGSPLWGDFSYKGSRTPHRRGQLLHAWKLDLRLKSGIEMNLEAPIPEDFKKFNFDWKVLK